MIAKKYISMLIAAIKTNVLLKNPANGGIPHIENIIMAKEKASCGFDRNNPDKSLKYFNLLKFPCLLIDKRIEKVATVITTYMIT